MARPLLAPLACLALLLVLPGAQAAQANLDPDIPDPEPIAPGRTSRIPITLVYTYEGDGSSSGQVTIHARASQADASEARIVDARFEPKDFTIDVNDASRRGVGSTDLVLTMHEQVEAFTSQLVELDLEAEESGNVEGTTTRASYRAEAAFSGNLTLTFAEPRAAVAEGRFTKVDLTGTSQANARVQAVLQTLEAPGGVQVGFVPTDTMEVPFGDPGSATMEVALLRQSSGPGSGTVQVQGEYTPWGADEPLQQTNVVTIAVHEDPLAGLLPWIVVGAIAVAVAVGVWWIKLR